MQTATRFAVAVLLSATCYFGAALAADWPGFRGPRGSGVSEEKDLPLPAGKESLLWKVKLPGPGASGPIAVGDKLFVTCYTGYGTNVSVAFGKGGKGGFGKGDFGKGGFGKGGFGGFGKPDPAELKEQEKLRLVLMCFDAKKGEVAWQKEIEPKLPENVFGGMIREHGYATSTPASDGERVYVFFGKSGVLAFDLEGKQLWHANVGSGINFFGMASSPVLYKDLVIVNASIESGALVALNKKTGKEVWKLKITGLSWGSPIIAETEYGKHELIVSIPDKVAAIDPQTGKEIWHCKGIKTGGGFGGFGGGPGGAPGGAPGGGKGGGGFGGGGYGGTYSTPTAHKGIVYVGGGGGPGSTPSALAIRMGGKGDVEESHVVWRQKAGTTYTSPVVLGDHVYFVDGNVTCLRTDTGKPVYKERLYESRGEYVSPVIVGDKLVVLTRFDGLFVVAAGKEFQQLATHEFPGDKSIFNAGPAIAGGRIYARSNEYLYCIGKK